MKNSLLRPLNTFGKKTGPPIVKPNWLRLNGGCAEPRGLYWEVGDKRRIHDDRVVGLVCLGQRNTFLESRLGFARPVDQQAIQDDDGLRVQRHRRADVPRHAMQTVAHGKLGRVRSFDDKMLLAMRDEFCLRHFEQLHARVRILRRHGLVAEVEAKTIRARLADDPRQQQRRR